MNTDSAAGTPWTTEEIGAILDEYLDMLQIEIAGGRVIKAQRVRALREVISRSRRAIENKHQNISAVMAALGLPFIWGYKPLGNYQAALFEAVASRISKDGLHEKLSQTDPESEVRFRRHLSGRSLDSEPDRALPGILPPDGWEYEPAPSNISRPSSIDPSIDRIIRRFDPAARDAKARALGEAGEAFLVQAERNRLSANGRDDLAAKVRWVAKEDGDGAGFDILSFSKCGREHWLEVKTTNGPAWTPFWISENELRVSEEHRDRFRLVRLYNFSWMPSAYRLEPPLTDRVHLIPVHYRAELTLSNREQP